MAHLILATPGMEPDVSELARATFKRESALDESAERTLASADKRKASQATRADPRFFRA
jgi:hypothetical protein